MNLLIRYITLLFVLLISLETNGQEDKDPPIAPNLRLVSVNQVTGNVEISWSVSPSPDVSGYVIYLYQNGEGYELDTIFNPAATSYLRTGSGSGYYSESFVVSALDTAGNISPLSNMLSTIFTSVQIDTCNKKMEIKWNKYLSVPEVVTEYLVYYSVNGGSYSDPVRTEPGISSLGIEDFVIDAQYCFFVEAKLSGGSRSGSNKSCVLTKMERPPDWINADYASVTPDNKIVLSFTLDPQSEIKHYILEKRSGAGSQYSQIHDFANISNHVIFVDPQADVTNVNYYRLKAINNCNKAVTWSNISSNIVLSAVQDEDEIELSWNPCRSWRGITDSNLVYIKTGREFEMKFSLPSADSSLTIPYSDLMYEASQKEICFMIRNVEASNPYNVKGSAISQIACLPVIEKITVPNVFTPDNNSVNDLFQPVLSFTPLSYRLVIMDDKRRTLFESTNYSEPWDGKRNGVPQPEGICLWFLKVRTPSGREITRTGTVTIVHNR